MQHDRSWINAVASSWPFTSHPALDVKWPATSRDLGDFLAEDRAGRYARVPAAEKAVVDLKSNIARLSLVGLLASQCKVAFNNV